MVFTSYKDANSKMFGKKINALEGDRAEFNHLINRMLDNDKETRATIDEVC